MSEMWRKQVVFATFFYAIIFAKERLNMFNDFILEKIFSHPEMSQIPIGCQSTAVHVFEEILEDRLGENPYATISELLTDD